MLVTQEPTPTSSPPVTSVESPKPLLTELAAPKKKGKLRKPILKKRDAAQVDTAGKSPVEVYLKKRAPGFLEEEKNPKRFKGEVNFAPHNYEFDLLCPIKALCHTTEAIGIRCL